MMHSSIHRRRHFFSPLLWGVLLLSWAIPHNVSASEEWYPHDKEGEAYLQELLKLKEQEGRDNALIHYIRAIRLFPIRNRGGISVPKWNDKHRDYLDRLIENSQPMFEELRKGAALNYAKGIPPGTGDSSPYFHYSALSMAVKIICLEARSFECRGEFPEALEDYLTGLTVGRDLELAQSVVSMFGNAVGIQQITLEHIHRLLHAGKMDRAMLVRNLEKLKSIEKSWLPEDFSYRNSYERSKVFHQEYLRRLREEPTERDLKSMQASADYLGITKEGWLEILESDFEIDQQIAEFRLQCVLTPYWERDLEEIRLQQNIFFDSMTEVRRKVSYANYSRSAFLRDNMLYLLMKTEMSLAQLATALEMIHLDQDVYPVQLKELVPDYLDKLPMDPFSGKHFFYQPSGDEGYRLWSVGPDGRDDHGELLYDPMSRFSYEPGNYDQYRDTVNLQFEILKSDVTGGFMDVGDLVFPVAGEWYR